uniref:Major facilitator superfamily (MFS) profile domain-containing protein n=1 Tax=Photinus pyralis TaxID=7054 RepID=A0A1Y1LYT6_PHOPY
MGATVIGSWIKVGAISPESYWIALLGQTVIAIAQALIMPIPPELAAVWFPSHQVSTACSIGVIGIEMGLAAGFIVPPLFFQCSSSGDDDVGKVLYQISMALSIVNTVVFILLIIFFKGRPKSPPSIGQLKFENSVPFLESAKTFMYNRSNILLVIAYGIVVGLMLSVSTLLNPLILSYYPDAQEDVGWIGLVMILGGMLGTIICGVALDVYGKFKQTILALSGLGIAAMICFTFAITRGIEFVYFMSAIFGFSTLGMQVGGLELGCELGYPIHQGIIAGILITSTQVSGIAFTYLYSYLLETHGGYYANLTMLALFVIEFLLLCSIKYNLRRRTVEMAHKERI